MGLPAKRRTKQSKRERASHFALLAASLTTCSHCKRRIPPHLVCPYCGYYEGRDVLHLSVRSDRKKAREKQREDKAKHH